MDVEGLEEKGGQSSQTEANSGQRAQSSLSAHPTCFPPSPQMRTLASRDGETQLIHMGRSLKQSLSLVPTSGKRVDFIRLLGGQAAQTEEVTLQKKVQE